MDCTVHELKQKRDQNEEFVLLDVRTEEELAIARLDPCHHIRLDELPHRAAELEPHAETEIICLCHHGGRSAQATQFLREAGFQNVRNLLGGIHAYAEEIDSSVPTY